MRQLVVTAGTRMADPRTRLAVVAICGRPNVGKSSLVNRIVGRRVAVVEHVPGVTRDRKELEAEWAGVPFVVVDTGGWMEKGSALDEKVSAQAERAAAGADLVLFVVDVTTGATAEDAATLRAIRRTDVPVLLVANKVDDTSREHAMWELLALGAGDPLPVSALHGRGSGDLLDEVVRRIARPERETHEPDPADASDACPRAAIVGRPNVGKSTLFNRLIGEDRSIVHDLPGTTRDSIDTVVETPEGSLRFVDTAGMRRRSRETRGPESHSTLRALQALDRADLALLVIDATSGATHQDQRLAERIGAAGCPTVVVLNKWDLVAADAREQVLETVADRLAFVGMAPVLRVSALSGRGVAKVLPALRSAVEASHERISTGALNRAIVAIQQAHPAPGARVRYAVQGAVNPPTFTLFATGRLPAPYLRYIERGLREHFGIGPTPMKIRVRIG